MKKLSDNNQSFSRRNFLKLAGAGMGISMLPGASLRRVPPQDDPDEFFRFPKSTRSRMASSENSAARKGQGARSNKGAKGHAFDRISAGETFTLLDTDGPGCVNRIKLTTDDRSPRMLRSLRIDMYWEGKEKPAVSAPLGDFFGCGLGQTTSFENELFSDPEGRSFNCFIPMPFRKHARITVTNDSDKDLHHIFYNVNFEQVPPWKDNILYFHGYWHRSDSLKLGEDFKVLPRVKGRGRFLGTNIGVIANPVYGDLWWGEGEVKTYLDGDRNYPTLVGTGTEDYIGTAWGMGKFINRFQGCLIADTKDKEWAFYRYHIPDPVYFHEDILVAIQQIGGGPKKEVAKLVAKGAPVKLISVDSPDKFYKLLEMNPEPDIHDKDFPEGWVNFYRVDDWSAMSYFYLDNPVDDLPALAPLRQRIEGLKQGSS